MRNRQPIVLWEFAVTALLCAVASIGASLTLTQASPTVIAGVWCLGAFLVFLGMLSCIRYASSPVKFVAVVVGMCYSLGTLPALPSLFWTPAAIVGLFQFSVGSICLWIRLRQLSTPIEPVRVAIKVSSPPASELTRQEPPLTIQPDSSESEEVNSELERALLSKLSLAPVSDADCESSEIEEAQPAVRFESAENRIWQRFERGRDSMGREWLEGTIRVDFSRGQKTSVVHVPFWPAFEIRPEVNSELLDGPQLKIEVQTVERWGIRLQLTRRAAGLDPDSAELAFFVTTQLEARGVA